jgi:hypothetical protein
MIRQRVIAGKESSGRYHFSFLKEALIDSKMQGVPCAPINK